jgi:ubiquinone/menaquinone biosynthesis C-methylase UbiE
LLASTLSFDSPPNMRELQANSIPLAAPFDAIAGVYDRVFSDSAIGQAQRKAVWAEMDRVFHSGHRILEINCGTGIDAVRMALRGIHVVACDSAPEMITQARQRIEGLPGLPVRFQCLPTEEIDGLAQADGPYDGLLSNFSGLNCISDLRPVARSLSRLVRPGGRFVVCLFGKFCLWEVLWYLRQDSARAFRRFRRHGVKSELAPGVSVTVRYWSVRDLQKSLAPQFRLERRRGIGVVSPPTYAASLAERFPQLFRAGAKIDPLLGWCPGVRAVSDHVVLTFQRVTEAGA